MQSRSVVSSRAEPVRWVRIDVVPRGRCRNASCRPTPLRRIEVSAPYPSGVRGRCLRNRRDKLTVCGRTDFAALIALSGTPLALDVRVHLLWHSQCLSLCADLAPLCCVIRNPKHHKKQSERAEVTMSRRGGNKNWPRSPQLHTHGPLRCRSPTLALTSMKANCCDAGCTLVYLFAPIGHGADPESRAMLDAELPRGSSPTSAATGTGVRAVAQHRQDHARRPRRSGAQLPGPPAGT